MSPERVDMIRPGDTIVHTDSLRNNEVATFTVSNVERNSRREVYRIHLSCGLVFRRVELLRDSVALIRATTTSLENLKFL